MHWQRTARIAVCLWCMTCASVQASSLYAIGNSLTNDSYPDGMQALALDAGLSLNVGYHIRSSASLTYMVAFPADVTLYRPATHDVALVDQAFDAVALQPYNGLGSPTYASERGAIITLIERVLQANRAATVFYLYSAWPNLVDTGGDFNAYWQRPCGVDPQAQPIQSRACYDALLSDLRSYFGNRASVRVIPVGDVLARIDRDAKAGLIPGITDMNALYRDQIHMGEVGRFVAASTVIATLFQQQPVSGAALSMFQFNDGVAQLTPTLASQLEGIIWSLVAADERTRSVTVSSSSSSSSANSSISSSSASSASSSASSSSSTSTSTSSASSTMQSATSSNGSGSLSMLLLILLSLLQAVRCLRDVDKRWHRSQPE